MGIYTCHWLLPKYYLESNEGRWNTEWAQENYEKGSFNVKYILSQMYSHEYPKSDNKETFQSIFIRFLMSLEPDMILWFNLFQESKESILFKAFLLLFVTSGALSLMVSVTKWQSYLLSLMKETTRTTDFQFKGITSVCPTVGHAPFLSEEPAPCKLFQ